VAAIVNICVDPRLNHEVIRAQVRARLERLRLPAQLVYITSDVGGNLGVSFRSTAELVLKNQDRVEFAAVFHHDDCVAGRLGLRKPLAESIDAARKALEGLGVRCPVLAGQLWTEHSSLAWADEPGPRYEVLTFRMPRL